MYNDFLSATCTCKTLFLKMRSQDEHSSQYFFEGVGLSALLRAARCNCSLNNHLSGVASLSFSTGLHSVLSCSDGSLTRTVAFPCLPGQLHHPLHQGWWLETFLSQRYVHLMWYRPVPWTLARQKSTRSLPAAETREAWSKFIFAVINCQLYNFTHNYKQ